MLIPFSFFLIYLFLFSPYQKKKKIYLLVSFNKSFTQQFWYKSTNSSIYKKYIERWCQFSLGFITFVWITQFFHCVYLFYHIKSYFFLSFYRSMYIFMISRFQHSSIPTQYWFLFFFTLTFFISSWRSVFSYLSLSSRTIKQASISEGKGEFFTELFFLKNEILLFVEPYYWASFLAQKKNRLEIKKKRTWQKV